MIEEGRTDDPLTDERPVIDAPTAEQLSGEMRAVRAPIDRSGARQRRVQRHQRLRRRRGIMMVVLGVVLAAGGAVWWGMADSPEVEPQVSGVSVVNTTSTIPAVPTTAP